MTQDMKQTREVIKSDQLNLWRLKSALRLLSLMGLIVAVFLIGQSPAQAAFPDRPVTMVLGSTPGSAPDTLARIIAVKMGEYLGQPVVVENRPGAAGSVAASSVARAKPDGYTIMLLTAVHSISPTLRKNIDYNLSRDFAGIGMIASVPLLFVVNKDLGVKTMDEFVERAKDGDVFYSTPGIGTLQHLSTEAFSREKGIKMTNVPYKGGGDATKAVISNEVQLFYAGIPPALPHVKEGTIIALGISTPKRSPAAPDVPTFQELGFPDYNVDNWHSLAVRRIHPRMLLRNYRTHLIKPWPCLKLRNNSSMWERHPIPPPQKN